MFESKAESIKYLLDKKLSFIIPETFIFSTQEWNIKKKLILLEIKKKFKKTKIIIRSSAKDEDGNTKSNAGKYLSIQNINSNNINLIKKSIFKVIRSYKSNNNKNEIIIQKQIRNVSMSGVLFTHDLNTGAPYYVINYDDRSGKTDTVTLGVDENSNKKIYIIRNGLNYLRSKRFRCLINATLDLQKKIDNNHLDIEFAVDKKLRPYLFQVRKITLEKKWDKISNNLIRKNLAKCRTSLIGLLKPNKGVFGRSTVFGQMPDWNPAEMIGQHPENLAYSLYEKLITNKSWKTARKEMGYYFPAQNKLMHSFSGKPYIDTRLSFNSFLPKGLSKSFNEKLVNFWLKKLTNNPELYDKIEFKIAITCFSFDIKKRIKENFPKKIKKKEIKLFIQKHKKNTIELINPIHKASVESCLKKIEKLIYFQKVFKDKNVNKLCNFKKINSIVNNCIKYGVVPFAICARHGFIAQTLLNSLENERVISKIDSEKFKKSFNTITSEFLTDMNKVATNQGSKKKFMEKYGHLRPGTYDIKSKRYDEYKSFIFLKQKIKKNKKFKFNQRIMTNIDKIILKNKLGNLKSEDLIEYIEKSIVSREFTKFVFTKSVSEILSLLKYRGKKNKINTEKLSFLEFYNFKKNTDEQKKIIEKNKKIYLINKKIKLPEILYDHAGTYVTPYQVNKPNYISDKKIRKPIIFIKNNIEKNNLKNKIVLIKNADPGYDWIFSRKIKGLITMFGGVNSHMAIRCAELNLPAAIGCGEKKFEELKKSKLIELDCSSQMIFAIN